MADYESEKSKGALYFNENRGGPKHPFYRGPVKITAAQGRMLVAQFKAGAEVVEARLAAWKNQGDNGEYIGLELEVQKPRDQQAAPTPPPPPPPPPPAPTSNSFDDFEDDIPF